MVIRSTTFEFARSDRHAGQGSRCGRKLRVRSPAFIAQPAVTDAKESERLQF